MIVLVDSDSFCVVVSVDMDNFVDRNGSFMLEWMVCLLVVLGWMNAWTRKGDDVYDVMIIMIVCIIIMICFGMDACLILDIVLFLPWKDLWKLE